MSSNGLKEVKNITEIYKTISPKSSLKFTRLLRVVFSSQQRLNQPAINAAQ